MPHSWTVVCWKLIRWFSNSFKDLPWVSVSVCVCVCVLVSMGGCSCFHQLLKRSIELKFCLRLLRLHQGQCNYSYKAITLFEDPSAYLLISKSIWIFSWQNFSRNEDLGNFLFIHPYSYFSLNQNLLKNCTVLGSALDSMKTVKVNPDPELRTRN